MPVISVGVDHDHATLELLEAVTVPDAEVHKVLAALRTHDDLGELVLVSTCLRTEVYAEVERFHGAVDAITAVLAERAGLAPDELAGSITVHFDRGVPAHLFAVAAGLRSTVPGETEVLGQLRRALERAEQEGTAGAELTELFRRALAAGRRARSETAIARGTTSFAHATVQLAADHLGTLDGRSVVVVGAGQLATGLLEALTEGRRGAPRRVVVANRTASSAASLAARTTSEAIEVVGVGLTDLAASVHGADLLVTAAEADGHLVSAATVAEAARPLLVIDLGMPRAVDAEVGAIDGVDLFDLAHLHGVIDAALRDRHDELEAAEGIVIDEVARYLEARRARGAAPVVTELRARLEELRISELERSSAELSEAERERIELVTKALVAKIAHDPTVALRESAGTDRGQRLADAVRTLFGL
jgi:glutamyl-tRNA reductase